MTNFHFVGNWFLVFHFPHQTWNCSCSLLEHTHWSPQWDQGISKSLLPSLPSTPTAALTVLRLQWSQSRASCIPLPPAVLPLQAVMGRAVDLTLQRSHPFCLFSPLWTTETACHQLSSITLAPFNPALHFSRTALLNQKCDETLPYSETSDDLLCPITKSQIS